ncbi:hypothetical protein MJM99_32390, partial [Salmonella enterica subsp. enterica serovar Kentucky]|nr:hypothetical protein [Salmonella enterica subsp. enterica serovar Kentucky]
CPKTFNTHLQWHKYNSGANCHADTHYYPTDIIRSKWDFIFSNWGLTHDAVPTSELPAHFLSHCERIKATHGKDRVIMHCHATNL